MDKTALRAALLLLEFKHKTKYLYQYERWLYDPHQQCMLIHVLVRPWWFITIVSDYGIKNFISATKAWRYIQTLIGD